MNTVLSLINTPLFILPPRKSKLWWLSLILVLLVVLSLVTTAVYASGFGGWVSEKLVGQNGVADSNLLIGRSGVSNSGLDVATSGVVTATGATAVSWDGANAHATLNGNLSSLRGFPSVSVHFEYGYSTSYGNTTVGQIKAATGAFTADITYGDPSKTVYYRSVVEADGTNYSSASSFTNTSGIATGFNILNSTVVIVYIAFILVIMIRLGQKSTLAALLFMAIAVYIGEAFVTIIQQALNQVFGG